MNTLEKVQAVVEQIKSIPPNRIDPGFRDLLLNFQALQGLASMAGINLPANPLELVLPADPVEADQTIDTLIRLLLELRGDDLPPFDPGAYGESIVTELLGGIGA